MQAEHNISQDGSVPSVNNASQIDVAVLVSSVLLIGQLERPSKDIDEMTFTCHYTT